MPSPEEVDRALAEQLDNLRQSAGWQKMLAWARRPEDDERSGKPKSGKTSPQTPTVTKAVASQEITEKSRAPKNWPEHIPHSRAS